MRIDIWSDIVCPFCYIGKRRLEAALERFEHRDQVEVVWHSFELDPNAPVGTQESTVEHVAAKYGIPVAQARQNNAGLAAQAATVGLQFNWEDALTANTFDAHRLVHLAATKSREMADEMEERLMRAFFTEGFAVDDRAVLLDIASDAGLDEAEAEAVLDSDQFAADVRADENAARQLGISGVPFFVFAEKYAVSGAQPLEVFENALATAWAETQPKPFEMVTGAAGAGAEDAPVCGPDGCELPK
ncbi:MAG: DsbA family oxidoreductase [Dermatophilus congolensis]|nr:DsbA family oxidoreductase [Dermatophilus congolensis]